MLNELIMMVNNVSLDLGVRKHLARALRRQVIVDTDFILGYHYRIDRLTDAEIHLGRKQGKITAIKAVRDRCNLGVLEAKKLVESEFSRLGLTFPDLWVSDE